MVDDERKTVHLMRKQKGFSLIELLIVVAIILIIAAIAIPNLLRARIAANESSAAAAEHTLVTSIISYASAYATVGYPSAISNLGPSASDPCQASAAAACLIDGVLASGSKSGYVFTATSSKFVGGIPTHYVTTAVPQTQSITGVKGFCAAEEDNTVRYITPAAAAATHDICLGGTYLALGN